MTTYTSAVEISHLRKTYGNLVAVDDVSVSVAEGEIFGILGPNGAGKTTAIECAIGLRRPDAGTIRLLGLDPHADPHRSTRSSASSSSRARFPAKLRVGEILEEYRSFYRDPADVDELLDVLGLAAKRGDYYRSLSGGQRQRLSIALALIGRPKIAVLDEMTTGLDPQARRDTWELIEQIRDRGTTIVLVTHFMEEAERLCDRVALIDHGRIVALDTPAGLAAQARGGKTVRFLPSAPFDDRLLTELPEVSRVERDGQHVVVTGTGELVNAVLFALRAAGLEARDVRLRCLHAGGRLCRAHRHATARGTRGNRTQGRSTGMSLHTLTAPRAPRAAFGKIVLNEARLAGRQPAGIVVAIGVSLLLLVIFGSIPVFQQTSARLGGLSAFEVYIPILISFSIGVLALAYLPGPLVSYRDRASCAACRPRRCPPSGCWPRSSSSRHA